MSSEHYDVVIVGAGLSGLAATNQLVQCGRSGFNIALVEARNISGGRTFTLPIQVSVPNSSGSIDLGAQWVGPEHTELLKLLDYYDLKLIEQFYPPILSPNSRLTECVGFRCDSLSGDDTALIDSYMQLITELSETINPNCPWEYPDAKYFDHMSVKDHVMQHIASAPAQAEILLFAQTVLAFIPSQISFLFFLFYIRSGGGMASLGDGEQGAQRWTVAGGMQQLSEKLVADLIQAGVRVHYEQAVEQIVLSDQGELTLHTRAGKTFHCAHAIVAISPQLITKIAFTPPLPENRLTAYSSITAGHAVKVYIVYSRSFWLERGQQNNAHFTTLGPVHNLFHSTFRSTTGDFPALVGLITGSAALQFERLNSGGRRKRVLEQIHAMYGDAEALTPLSFEEKLWASEEFSGGCFAGVYPPNGTFSEYGSLLRTPMEGVIHWASTETAVEFYGYMEGAIRAGQRAAEEIRLPGVAHQM